MCMAASHSRGVIRGFKEGANCECAEINKLGESANIRDFKFNLSEGFGRFVDFGTFTPHHRHNL